MKYKALVAHIKTRLTKKKRAVIDPQLMHPKREWAIGLSLAAVIFLVCGYLSIESYVSNRSITAFVAHDDSEQTVYRESIVDEALVEVESRKHRLSQLTQSGVAKTIIEIVATTTLEEVETEPPVTAVPDTAAAPSLGD